MLWLLSGCQLVLGDFTVDSSEGRQTPVFGDVCAPDTFRCTGAQLQRCSDDRASWVTVETCPDADHCDPTAAACRTCTPGQWACNGAALESCDPNSHWTVSSTVCPSAALCVLAGDRSTGTCGATACGPAGAHSCDGNRLLRCSAGLDARELVDRCGSAALCDAAKADVQARSAGRGTCTPPTCLIGTYRCDGASVERCRDDETAWDPVTTCDDAASCNPLTGDCSACSPGDAACSGRELWVCGESGFAKADTCATPELCNGMTGACENSQCSKPGATRCNADEGVVELQECGNDQRWATREVCASTALCSESVGVCIAPACSVGAVRCFGQVHQTCSDDLTHWVDDMTCPAGQSCDADGCKPACTSATGGANAYRCDGATLERCASDGAWEPQNRCVTNRRCDATGHACLAPACGGPVLGDYKCFGDQNLNVCSDSRETFTDFYTCPTGTVCDADPAVGSGRPSCDACRALQYSCADGTSGMELHLCTADGTAAPLVSQCPGGCSVSADNLPSCVQMP